MSANDVASKADPGLAPSGDEGVRPLLGRKSVLMGLLTSGFVIANAAQSSSASAGTTKPIAAAPSGYITKWTPATAYPVGTQVVSPSPCNDVVAAKVAHTSSAAYTTDTAKWSPGSMYVQQGQVSLDLARQTGVDNTGSTECAAAIQAAINAAAASGIRVFARGTYKIASTVTLTSSAELSDATFKYTGTGVAVRVGAASGLTVDTIDINLPQVVATAKTMTGWAQVAGSIGVELVNLNSSRVYVPFIRGFATGLRVTGRSQGCCYNEITLGLLDTNQVNLLLDADTNGWSNQNLFNAGRFAHDSAEGTNIPGVRHVAMLVCTNPINNNTWTNTSLEGLTPEFTAAIAGTANVFLNARWEASDGAKVRWESDASNNQIFYGYDAQSIVETFVSGASGNVIFSGNTVRFAGGNGGAGVMVLENGGSSTYPADIVMYAGATTDKANPATAYSVARGSNATHMKRSTDTGDRIMLDHVNGTVALGTGSGAPVVRLTATTVVTGTAATGGRPAAATAKAGAMFYDTTLSKPIWSNGTVWKDANGTTV
jgi:hypothetical protein